MISRIFRAREQIDVMCSDQEEVGMKRTPRYLKEETSLKGDPAKDSKEKLGRREGV